MNGDSVAGSYQQSADPLLKTLASWWQVMGRQAAVDEVSLILQTAQEELRASKMVFEAEYSRHKETKSSLNSAIQKAAQELSRHEETLMKLTNIKSKLTLLTTVLGASTEEHPKYLAFHELFRNDFMNFANSESLYEREAEAILRMQAVEEELRLLGRVPLFRKKTIVAVAGGFSSGKSSLITSFFEPAFKVTLPIAMEPVTAIPTFIAHNSKTQVMGFPSHGGSVEIASPLFAKMKHDFLKSLGFDLRRIMPFMMLETPWRKSWEHLCFIDTPGYNPAKGDGATAADDSTTAEALLQADALLWVLGIDANGEMSSNDLEYLSTHAGNLPLAIIVNKADSRPLSHIEEIVEQIRDTLDGYGIQYYGISAYSSVNGEEYFYIGQPLEEIISNWNSPNQRDKRLCEEALAVLDGYLAAFDTEMDIRINNKKTLNSIKLDLDELGLFDEIDPLQSDLEKDAHLKENGKRGLIGFFDNLLNVKMSEDKSELVKTPSKSAPSKPSVSKKKSAKEGESARLMERPVSNRRNEVKENVLERLQSLEQLFGVATIQAHKQEAIRLRERVIEIFSDDW